MKITSPDFMNNTKIPVKFTADGENINPGLIVEDIPDNAKSLVLTVDDPDAQKVTGRIWVHWVVFNIPVKGKKILIKENSIPGNYGESTYKKPEYGGPNPPEGMLHHYYFKVYAINKILDLKEGATLVEIQNKIQRHILDKAELIGLYER